MKEPIHLDDEAVVPELRVPIGHQRIDVPILGVDDEQCRMGRRSNGCQRAPSSTASRTRASSGRRPRHGPNTPPAVNVVTGNIIPYYWTRQKSDCRVCWGPEDLSPLHDPHLGRSRSAKCVLAGPKSPKTPVARRIGSTDSGPASIPSSVHSHVLGPAARPVPLRSETSTDQRCTDGRRPWHPSDA